MVAPPDWRYKYPPHKWHDELIVEAINKVERFPHEETLSKPLGYDHELARAVMDALNEAFPHSLALIDLKYQFGTEPSDIVLSSVLDALRGDGFVDGAKGFQNTSKLNPLEKVTLTAEGRRHLDEAMKKRSKPQRPYSGNEATEFILQQLLSEFRERQLTSTDLHRSYQGLSPSELKNRSLAAGIIEVDFDLAMSELDNHGLVKTGPMAVYDNPPGGLVTVIGLYSKREYSYLTENGYREVSKSKSIPLRSARTIIQGDQYNIGQAGAVGPHSTGTINHQPQWTAIHNQVDLAKIANELEKLRLHLAQSATTGIDYAQLQLVAEAKDAATKQDGNKVIEFLTKGGKALRDVAIDFGAKLTAELIAKQSGLS
jgi:DNA-binding PadR family transcriptional regulator